jgi:hypothetical protein
LHHHSRLPANLCFTQKHQTITALPNLNMLLPDLPIQLAQGVAEHISGCKDVNSNTIGSTLMLH